MLSTRLWMRNLWSAASTMWRSVSPASESNSGGDSDVFVYWIDGVGVCSGATFVVRLDEPGHYTRRSRHRSSGGSGDSDRGDQHELWSVVSTGGGDHHFE